MNKSIKTTIIPKHQTFAKVEAPHELDLQAICVFAAIGFFLDADTYWKDQQVLRPASTHILDSQSKLTDSKSYFQWHYSPRDLTFDQALEEFTHLFESIVAEQSQQKHIILPLSGGLDSRTQAAALKSCHAKVFAYSYEFENGYEETKIAKKIAKACDFEFQSLTIPKGYLWNSIDQLVQVNQCYSDFTTPRQMAIFDKFEGMGDQFSLGHWGDVLFDSMNLPQLSLAEEVQVLKKKLLKKGGLPLALSLWKLWELEGDFDTYFTQRVETLLESITIKDSNAKLRAFKSLYWAPRWTSVNLAIFSAKHPISLPYYDDRMCQFICTVPEDFLKDRQLQIAYLKAKAPDLANITWQDKQPYNLTNFERNRPPYNTPYKVVNKLKRMGKQWLGRPYTQRNWELQFLGADNQAQVTQHLLHPKVEKWIPNDFLKARLNEFYKKSSVENAHALNIVLVLSKFKAQHLV